MTTPLDVQGILERAGADPNAPEGSQGLALAQVARSHAELVKAAEALFSQPLRYADLRIEIDCGSHSDAMQRVRRMRAALAQVSA